MKTFQVRNTNEAMNQIYPWLQSVGVYTESRNGPVLVAPCSVSITYERPDECVNLCPVRDANPFFHVLESLWMLSGSRRINVLTKMLPSFVNFSDDGTTHNAAYGYRARRQYNKDQFQLAAAELKNDSNTRQAIVQLWDVGDLGKVTNDKACNMLLVFMKSRVNGKLDMTVCNRSNDAIWGGVAGANVVHMNYIHQYVAALAGMEQGIIEVVSTNLHLYTENPKYAALMREHSRYQHDTVESYTLNNLYPTPIIRREDNAKDFDNAVKDLLYTFESDNVLYTPDIGSGNEFITMTALPMLQAWQCHHNEDSVRAMQFAETVVSSDWRMACIQWLKRRA